MESKTMKVVYTVVERAPGKSFWTKVGVGFVNQDGSMNLRLDAIPVNGTLQVRDWEPTHERDRDRRASDAFGGGVEDGHGPRARRREVVPAMPSRDMGGEGSRTTFPGDALA